MLAIDTNVVVRYITNDHPEQSAKARVLVNSGPVFLATTVLLESEWVLRSAYRYDSSTLSRALRAFAGLPTVFLEEPTLAAQALDRLARGMDFADALHLASARDCEAFVTFDRNFIKAANALGHLAVREP